LLKYKEELQAILEINKIDICLITETHFTNETHMSINNYNTFHTVHPSNNGRGGSAVIVKNSLIHHEEEKLSCNEFQATTINIATKKQHLSFTSVYSPPRHSISVEQYKNLIQKHKHKFIMGGDFNAKHTHWGSRLTTTKGRNLLKAAQATGCQFISSGKPTYWPTDTNKTPDLIDFFVTNKIADNFTHVEDGTDLCSDHSPVYLTISENIIFKEPKPSLSNKHTDWNFFRVYLERHLNPCASIQTAKDLEEEIYRLTKDIQSAAWNSTPALK